MSRKIIIGLIVLVCSTSIYAKGSGGGSWGEEQTTKYGKKSVVSNSKSKTPTFSSNDVCKKYIYIDTFLSYRTKNYFWGLNRIFQDGYATTKITLGNDVKKCNRTDYKVPYLNIDQVVGPRGGKAVAYKDGKNISFIRLSLIKNGVDFSTMHETKFRDGSKSIIEMTH